MPTSPRRPAKKGGSVKNPKAAKVKRYEIKPLRWVEISEYCWFAKSIMGECRLWKTEKGYWFSTRGSRLNGTFSQAKLNSERWYQQQLRRALRKCKS